MPQPRPGLLRPLPPWILVCGSVAVAGHLAALGLLALAAPSGPWPTPFGASTALAPAFAEDPAASATRNYLLPLHMSHNYHFDSDRPAQPGVWFEVRLRDEQGKELRTVRVPDPGASFWVRHRQERLARALADDRPVQPPAGKVVPAPGQAVHTVDFWDVAGDGILRLKTAPEHLIPRDRPVFRPSGWSLVLARSYVRHLCRAHGAASGELVRHTREPVLPAVLLLDEPPPGTFAELISYFGEVRP